MPNSLVNVYFLFFVVLFFFFFEYSSFLDPVVEEKEGKVPNLLEQECLNRPCFWCTYLSSKGGVWPRCDYV